MNCMEEIPIENRIPMKLYFYSIEVPRGYICYGHSRFSVLNSSHKKLFSTYTQLIISDE